MSNGFMNRRAGAATGLALLFPITLSTMAIVLLVPILPMLMQHFAEVPGRDYLVPMILTVPALCVALLSPLAGYFGDRFGRRRLLIWALFLYGVIGTAPLFLSSFGSIFLSRVGVGITEAAIVTLSTTMIADYFQGESRNRWLAGQTALASVSALIFFAVGGLLGEFGWRAPFLVYASAFIMMAAVMFLTWEVEPDRDAGVKKESGWAAVPLARTAAVVGITLFGSILFYALQIQVSPGLAAHGVSEPAKIGLFTAMVSVGVVVGTLIFSRLSRSHVATLLASAFALISAGLLAMGFGAGPTHFLAGAGLAQIGAGMLLPTLLVWAVSGVPFEVRGRVTGIWTGAFTFGQFLSPIAVTFIAGRMGGLLPGFQILGYAALFAAAASAITRLLKTRHPADAAAG